MQLQRIFRKMIVRGHNHFVRSVSQICGTVKLCLVFTTLRATPCQHKKGNSNKPEGRPPLKETCHLG